VLLADLETTNLAGQAQIDWTFYWPDAHRWEGENFAVRVVAGCPSAGAHPPAGRRVAWGGVQLTARRLLRRRALQPERAQAVRAPSLVCYELIS
jgi:hypothetical protein